MGSFNRGPLRKLTFDSPLHEFGIISSAEDTRLIGREEIGKEMG
jgi:hypothetical protein